MEIRVEGRRSIRKLRETWLENVEAYMAELVIDREDNRDGKKWRGNVIIIYSICIALYTALL